MLRKLFVAAVPAVVFGIAGGAQAVNVNPLANQAGGIQPNALALGTAAVAPYVTDATFGDLMTAVLVTNARSTPIGVELVFIDGEPDGAWDAPSLPPCILSPRETTVLRFTPSGTDTVVDYECSNAVFDPSQTAFPPLNGLNTQRQTVLDDSRKGFVLVLAQFTTGTGTPADPVSVDVEFDSVAGPYLVADWTIVDYAAGEAYSAPAFHFDESGVGTSIGSGKTWSVPSVPAVSATNVILPDCEDPDAPASCDVDVELILVPMDGRLGEPPMQTVNLDLWNDDEVNVDRKYDYACFDIVRLAAIDSRFNAASRCPTVAGFDTAPNGCVGHLELTNLLTTGGALHDVTNGDGNFIRISATIAWVVHRFRPTGAPNPGVPGILDHAGAGGAGTANRDATARLFVTSLNGVTRFGADARPGINFGFLLSN